MSSNRRIFLAPRNVKKWEKFGHIVIRFDEMVWPSGPTNGVLSSCQDFMQNPKNQLVTQSLRPHTQTVLVVPQM
jgi:hypothetical protein